MHAQIPYHCNVGLADTATIDSDVNFEASSSIVDAGMACGTECDQVLLRIIAGVTSKFQVVNFEV